MLSQENGFDEWLKLWSRELHPEAEVDPPALTCH